MLGLDEQAAESKAEIDGRTAAQRVEVESTNLLKRSGTREQSGRYEGNK